MVKLQNVLNVVRYTLRKAMIHLNEDSANQSGLPGKSGQVLVIKVIYHYRINCQTFFKMKQETFIK